MWENVLTYRDHIEIFNTEMPQLTQFTLKIFLQKIHNVHVYVKIYIYIDM